MIPLQIEIDELNNKYYAAHTWDQKSEISDRIQQLFGIIVDRNIQGRELEKQGKVQEAIKLYEQNAADEVETPFPYERLAILYRKSKRDEDEVNILKRGIFNCDTEQARTGYNRMKKRLEKIKQESD